MRTGCLFLALLALAAQDDPAADAVRKLGSDSIEERDSAFKKLRELGEGARRALEAASKDSDKEVAQRAAVLLGSLEIRRRLSPRIQTVIPGIDERLAAGGDHEWTEILFASQTQSITESDFQFLAPRAIRGAVTPQEKTQILQIVSSRRVRTAVPEMLGLLIDPDPGVSGYCASVIAGLDGPELRKGLLALAEKGPPANQVKACQVLINLGVRESAPALAKLLTHPDASLQRIALDAIVRFESRDEAPQVLTLLKTGDPRTKQAAANALRALDARSTIPALAAMIGTKEPEVRIAALRTLEFMKAREAQPDVLRAFKDPDSEVRAAAVWAIARMGGPLPIDSLLGMLSDEAREVRVPALWGLGRSRAKEAAPGILKALKDPDRDVRKTAAWAAGMLELREAGPTLIANLADPNLDADCTLWAAGRLRLPEAAPQVLKILKADNPHAEDWEDAAVTAGRIGCREAIPHLLKAPQANRGRRDQESLNTAAIVALRAFPVSEVLPHLKTVLEGNDGPRLAAAQALAALLAPETKPLLLQLLDDPQEAIQGSAALALGRMGVKEAVPKLLAMLDNPTGEGAGDAAEALSYLGAREALPVIRHAVQEQDHRSDEKFIRALERFGDADSRDFVIAGMSRAGSESIFAAGLWLCREGRKVAIRPILDDDEFFLPLNALRRPEEWKALFTKTIDADLDGTTYDVVESLARAAGLTLEWEREDWEPDIEQLLERTRIPAVGGRMTILEALLPLVHLWDNEYEIILEPGRMRIVPYSDAERFWTKWGEDALKEK